MHIPTAAHDVFSSLFHSEHQLSICYIQDLRDVCNAGSVMVRYSGSLPGQGSYV